MKDEARTEFQDMLAALRALGAEPVAATAMPPATVRQDGPGWAAMNRLERECALLIDHAEMLACALGACPDCWGTIEDCEECGGIGRPGAFNPDPACFEHFVLPVITRMMAGGRPDAPGDRDGYPQV